MQIFRADQIKQIDQQTIQLESASSLDLMERASKALLKCFLEIYNEPRDVVVFAGLGNNGGDALAFARLLHEYSSDWNISVYAMEGRRSSDCQKNFQRLSDITKVKLSTMKVDYEIPTFSQNSIVVDGLLGTGLSRPVEGFYEHIISYINTSKAEVFSIDVPSGLMCEDNSTNGESIVEANHVVSFQFPKLIFMLSESNPYIHHWMIGDIGLHRDAVQQQSTPYHYITDKLIKSLIIDRKRFSHKGTFGHAFLVAGKTKMMGAAVLAARACLRSGVGLLTTHIPLNNGYILQTTVPEAILSIDRSELMFTDVPALDDYDAVGIGPGIGVKPNTQYAFFELIKECGLPMVLDADALNILSKNKEWLKSLTPNTVLTPHPREFDRLTHDHTSGFDRIHTQQAMAKEWQVVIVVKGAHSSIAFPDGRVFFNSTGNHGMATAGSGDVLTGIILGLLSQGYSPQEASLIGVWWHGASGDHFAKDSIAQTMIASDIIEHLRYVDM